MAITAWSAKVWSRAIWLSENGLISARRSWMTPIGVPSRTSGTLSVVRKPKARAFALASGNSSVSTWRSAT